ncbi:hypothetical protein COBT_001891 [Conglomerata obtusa]
MKNLCCRIDVSSIHSKTAINFSFEITKIRPRNTFEAPYEWGVNFSILDAYEKTDKPLYTLYYTTSFDMEAELTQEKLEKLDKICRSALNYDRIELYM